MTAISQISIRVEKLEATMREWISNLQGGWRCCIDHILKPEHPCPICKLDKIEEQIKVLEQTLLEVSHAQQCGAQWYTKGEDGLYLQVSGWVRRGQSAIDEINKIIKENP